MTLGQWLTLVKWSVQPTALTWLLVGNGLLLGFRVFAAVDAFISAGNEARPHGVGAVAAAAAAVAAVGLLTIPHAVAGYADVTQYDLITTVFAPTGTTQPPVTTLPAVTTTTAPSDPTENAGTLPPPPTTTTTTTPPDRIWDGTERLNVLLLGGDARPSSSSIRTDTIILASIDPQAGHVALFSVPRNMAEVPLPDSIDTWRCNCFPGIINALWRYGDEHPDEIPESGIHSGATAIKLAMEQLTGLPVHYYALVNLTGFVEVIDAIGGLDITVPERLRDPNYGTEDGVTREVIDIEPGDYHMDGHTALAYARSRRTSDDYNRMGRQRCVLQALAEQADPVSVIRSFPTIATAVKKNLLTDIPIEALPDFIEILPRLDSDEVISVRFLPGRFTGPRTPEGYNTPDVDEIRKAVEIAVTVPAAEARAALGLEATARECG
jgi:LCP family protein required for cell wall assembly